MEDGTKRMKDRLHHAFDIVLSWGGVLATVSLAQISLMVSIAAGTATFLFTVHRWIHWHNHKDKQ